jgi:hypothetical protein
MATHAFLSFLLLLASRNQSYAYTLLATLWSHKPAKHILLLSYMLLALQFDSCWWTSGHALSFAFATALLS